MNNEIKYTPFIQQSEERESSVPSIRSTIENKPTAPLIPKQRMTNVTIEPYRPEFNLGEGARQLGRIEFKHQDTELGNMQALVDQFQKHGINMRITSGLRRGATTKQGNVSGHSQGEAIDITPIEGQSFDDLKQALKSSPELVQGMKDNGYGIIDETTPEMLKRTGGTGAHGHIGKDNLAKYGLDKILSAKKGGKISLFANGGRPSYSSFVSNNAQTNNQSTVPLTPVSVGYISQYSIPYGQSQQREDNSGGHSPKTSPMQEAEQAFENINTYGESQPGRSHNLNREDFVNGFVELRQYGFTKDYVNAILANGFQESKFKPDIQNQAGGSAKYIPQFLGERINEYESFMKRNNLQDGVHTAAKYLIDEYNHQRIYNEELGKHNQTSDRIKNKFKELIGEDSYEYYLTGKGNYNPIKIEAFEKWLNDEGLSDFRFNNRTSFDHLNRLNTFSRNDIRNNVTDLSSYPTGKDAITHFYNGFERGGQEQFHNRDRFFDILNK